MPCNKNNYRRFSVKISTHVLVKNYGNIYHMIAVLLRKVLRKYTVPVKSLDTPTHSRIFPYFYYFLHCRIIVKTSELGNNTYGIM